MKKEILKELDKEFPFIADFPDCSANNIKPLIQNFISQALDKQKAEFLNQPANEHDQEVRRQALNEFIEKLEQLKTDERKVATFGDWQAETYEDKMLVNAVLDDIKEIINQLKQ